jgi:hypothetical protein
MCIIFKDLMPTSSPEIKALEKTARILMVLCCTSILLVLVLAWYVFDKKQEDVLVGIPPSTNSELSVNKNTIQIEQGGKNSGSATLEYDVEITNDEPEIGGVVKNVAKHMLLPRGEYTVGQIENIQGLLAEQPDVYRYAENGDKIIWYPEGMIIYNPFQDRIVDIRHE